jgi:uncharacterized protein YmfQ (DUF2313 family)
MGIVVASEARYESAVKKLFPQGDYWDGQFADPSSDVSLFAKAMVDGLVRFRSRMSDLQNESRIETTVELIASWERVLLGEVTHGKTLEKRREILFSKEDTNFNLVKLQKTAERYGFAITEISFPYRPGFFGFTRFNQRVGNPAVFSVLLITVSRSDSSLPDWETAKNEFEQAIKSRLLVNQIVYFDYGGA